MHTMLKTEFFSAVKSLLADGFKPTFYTVDNEAIGIISWVDGNGTKQVEQAYSRHTPARDIIAKRFRGWFETIMAEHNAKEEGIPLPEVVYTEKQGMTPTEAVQHMAYTLAGAIEQSKKPGFDADAAYADIETNFDHVATECRDLAIIVWLKNHLCFGYIGDKCTFADVNEKYLTEFNHILATGWLPPRAQTTDLESLFEMDWWGASNIAMNPMRYPTHITGHAMLTDEQGLFQIGFDWAADFGEEARAADLPAIISVLGGRFILPYEITLKDCDVLEVIEELDCALGLSADIFNHLSGLGLIPGLTSQGVPNDNAESEAQHGKL